jgi:hypothetical protein
MDQLLVRFGLPWIIFSSALYALYWVVVYGESVSRIAPSASVAIQTSNAPEAVAPTAIHSTGHRNRAIPAGPLTSNPPPDPAPVQAPTSAREKYVVPPQPTRADPLTGLQDADPNNRFNALTEIDAQGLTIPAHTLQQLATSDPDPSVRILAMTKYAQDPLVDPAMVRAAVEVGVRDSDATVRAQARDLLLQLEQSVRSNDELPQLLADEAPAP